MHVLCHESLSPALAQDQRFPHHTMFMYDSNSVGLTIDFTAFCGSSRAVSEVYDISIWLSDRDFINVSSIFNVKNGVGRREWCTLSYIEMLVTFHKIL